MRSNSSGRRVRWPLAVLMLTAGCHDAAPPLSPPASVAESSAPLPAADLRLMVDTITKGIVKKSSEGYVAPSAAELQDFEAAVDSVLAGGVSGAAALLDGYAYDVVRFRETVSGDTLVVIRERIPAGGTVARGWGTYVYNPAAAVAADVHVNHPIDDQHSEDVGADLYRSTGARWLLMAGARRTANADGSADMARSTGSVFHRVHQRVASASARAVSIHGFRIENHSADSIPPDAHFVLSNGRSDAVSRPRYTAADSTLRTRLRDEGFVAGLTRADSGYLALTATQNPQGRHSNTAFSFGRWIHVEHERAVRDDSTAWKASNAVLRQWMLDHP